MALLRVAHAPAGSGPGTAVCTLETMCPNAIVHGGPREKPLSPYLEAEETKTQKQSKWLSQGHPETADSLSSPLSLPDSSVLKVGFGHSQGHPCRSGALSPQTLQGGPGWAELPDLSWVLSVEDPSPGWVTQSG